MCFLQICCLCVLKKKNMVKNIYCSLLILDTFASQSLGMNSSSNSSFVPATHAHFILRWPAQNGPMTHFVPQVIAEVKITWMWKPLEPIGHSQKVAAVTGSHTQEGQRSPHPGTFTSYINAESDKQDRKCREGKARLAHLAAFLEKKSHTKTVQSNRGARCYDLVKTNYNNWCLQD